MYNSTRRKAGDTLVLVALSLLATHSAYGQDTDPIELNELELEQLLRDADNTWLFSDYNGVIELLQPIFFPAPVNALSHEQQLDGYVLLGTSFLFLGNEDMAREALLRLLILEPDYELEPLHYPSSMINFLEALKEEFQEQLDEIRAQRGDTPSDTEGTLRYVEVRIEERTFLASILPFGVGHFYNDMPEWGILYLSVELILAGTSVGFYVANEADRTQDGYFPDEETARTRQTVHESTAWAFIFVVLTNMIHGALIHEDYGEISQRVLEEPPFDDSQTSRWSPFAQPVGGNWVLGFQTWW